MTHITSSRNAIIIKQTDGDAFPVFFTLACFVRLKKGRIVNTLITECSQPSVFLHSYLIAERADRIERELDASQKRNT